MQHRTESRTIADRCCQQDSELDTWRMGQLAASVTRNGIALAFKYRSEGKRRLACGFY